MAAKALTPSLAARASQAAVISAGGRAFLGTAGRSSLVMSQTNAVVSSLAEANDLPSGAKAMALTWPLWPWKAASALPLAMSQTWISRSGPAWARHLPSGETATRRIG